MGLAPAWAAEAKKKAKAPDNERMVALDQVPGPAKAAILNLAGKNKIVSIEEVATREGKLYEATWMAGGKEVEVLVSEKGKVLSKEAAKEGKQPKGEKPRKGEKAEKPEKAPKQKEAKPEKGKRKVEDEDVERAKGPKAKARQTSTAPRWWSPTPAAGSRKIRCLTPSNAFGAATRRGGTPASTAGSGLR